MGQDGGVFGEQVGDPGVKPPFGSIVHINGRAELHSSFLEMFSRISRLYLIALIYSLSFYLSIKTKK